MAGELTHIDHSGQPRMVDVSAKAVTLRTATATGTIRLGRQLINALEKGELQTKKGPVFHTAIIAGIQAAKKTSDLIPMCHILPLEGCKIEISPVDEESVLITAKVKATHKTGVEMEALTAVSVAALTIYDMCKALSRDMVIGEIRLIEKTGGSR